MSAILGAPRLSEGNPLTVPIYSYTGVKGDVFLNLKLLQIFRFMDVGQFGF